MSGAPSSVPEDVLELLPAARQMRQAFDVLAREGPTLLQRAYVDSLTGLFNAVALDDLLAGDFDHERYAVVCLDLTGFKTINDRLGHSAGDSALKRVGGSLLSVLAATQAVSFRVGGDEFVMLIERRRFSILRKALAGLTWPDFAFEQKAAPFGASKGAALPGHGTVFNELKRRADDACKVSKLLRRDSLVVWRQGMRLPPNDEQRFRCGHCRASIRIVPPPSWRGSVACPCCRSLLQ
jgi:diguanylate cyclase (GGDEF)-like protein